MSCLVKIESLCGRENLLITYSKSNHHWDCCSIGWYVVVNSSPLKRESFAKLSLNKLESCWLHCVCYWLHFTSVCCVEYCFQAARSKSAIMTKIKDHPQTLTVAKTVVTGGVLSGWDVHDFDWIVYNELLASCPLSYLCSAILCPSFQHSNWDSIRSIKRILFQQKC